MKNAEIFLSDALKIMQLKDKSGKPFLFNLSFRSYNSQTKQGGKLYTYENVKYLPEANKNNISNKSEVAIFSELKSEKNPAHFKNRTRNIELSTGEIKKVRIDFIISINNKKVIY